MSTITARLPTPASGCRVTAGFLTDRGRVRDRNEDAYTLYLPYADEPSRIAVDALFAVADGMGGHERGDLASRFVIEAVNRSFAGAEAGVPSEVADLRLWIERLIRETNRGLLELGTASGNGRSMGSTLTLAVLRERTILLGHVGDSRCYRMRGDELEQLTEDHSWVAEQRRAGFLTADEEASHPNRNWLTQCLGMEQDPHVYLREEPIFDGDRYLLCSDGVHGFLSKLVLKNVLREEAHPQAVARRLIGLANEAGGADNLTAVVFDVIGEHGHSPPERPQPADPALTATSPGSEVAQRRRFPMTLGPTLILGLMLAVGVAVGTWLSRPPRPVVFQQPAAVTQGAELPPVPAAMPDSTASVVSPTNEE